MGGRSSFLAAAFPASSRVLSLAELGADMPASSAMYSRCANCAGSITENTVVQQVKNQCDGDAPH